MVYPRFYSRMHWQYLCVSSRQSPRRGQFGSPRSPSCFPVGTLFFLPPCIRVLACFLEVHVVAMSLAKQLTGSLGWDPGALLTTASMPSASCLPWLPSPRHTLWRLVPNCSSSAVDLCSSWNDVSTSTCHVFFLAYHLPQCILQSLSWLFIYSLVLSFVLCPLLKFKFLEIQIYFYYLLKIIYFYFYCGVCVSVFLCGGVSVCVFVHMCMHTRTHLPQHLCEGQRTTFESEFSPSTVAAWDWI